MPEEGTQSTFLGLQETIEKYGLFCSFYTDRGSHYWFTPKEGGKVSKHQLTQVSRTLKQLKIQHIVASSPQARGRSERMFGTLQNRLPVEMALRGIPTIDEANQYFRDVFLPKHNAQFSVAPKMPESAYIPWVGPGLKKILCIKDTRIVQQDNMARKILVFFMVIDVLENIIKTVC